MYWSCSCTFVGYGKEHMTNIVEILFFFPWIVILSHEVVFLLVKQHLATEISCFGQKISNILNLFQPILL